MTPPPDVRILDQRLPEERDRPFLPGMGKTWLLPLYDIFTRLTGVRPLHERAVELAGIAPGQTVVDVGCGTGNLSFAVLAAQPEARVTGLDPDGDSLRRAARKARRRRVSLTLVQGYADRIPADDASLDHVVSSLALHHVDDDGRVAFARDALRALRPGGKVTIVDFGGPGEEGEDAEDGAHGHGHARGHGHGHAHGHGSSHRHGHGSAHGNGSAHGHGGHDHARGWTDALRHLPHLLRSRVAKSPAVARNLDDGLVTLLAEAGFADAREVDYVDHRFGRIAFVQASRP